MIFITVYHSDGGDYFFIAVIEINNRMCYTGAIFATRLGRNVMVLNIYDACNLAPKATVMSLIINNMTDSVMNIWSVHYVIIGVFLSWFQDCHAGSM